MNQENIRRYIITITGGDRNLAEVNELTTLFTADGFQLTYTDDEGKVHELGPATFCITSGLSENEIQALAEKLAQAALSGSPQISITEFKQWLHHKAHGQES